VYRLVHKSVPTVAGGSSQANPVAPPKQEIESRYSRTQLSGLDRLAPSSSPTIRSLIADIEIKAHHNRAPLQMIPLHLNGAVIGRTYCFERRLGGIRTGICDGVVVLAASWEPALIPWLCHRLQDFAASDLATFRIVEETVSTVALEEFAIRNRSMIAAVRGQGFQELLPLPGGFDDFLKQFGRSTRRNIVRGLDQAQEDGMCFRFGREPALSVGSDLRRLAAKNMPRWQSFKKLAAAQDFVAAHTQPFGASLADGEGRLISAAGGFIEDDVAFMVYQANHRDYRHANPSLILRSLLAEQLIAQRVGGLAFIGSCAGSLLRYCERVRGAELLLARHSLSARMKHFACLLAQPKSRIGQMTATLRAQLPDGDRAMPGMGLGANRFERLRSELKQVKPPRS
jgi:hypothetical protein